jgi:uncharacterized membrane protein
VSFDDWMLALHVLSAFSYVAGMTLFWVLVVAVRRIDTPRETLQLNGVARLGNVAVGIGAGGTIIIGIWLAFSVGNYDIWDFWIILALVLWVVAAAIGRRTGEAYLEGPKKAQELEAAGQTGANAKLLALNRTSQGLLLHSLSTVVLLLILIDMIWKPWA